MHRRQRLNKAKKQANTLAESSELSGREKVRAIEKALKQAKTGYSVLTFVSNWRLQFR
jgi:hypothetical protein